MTVEFLLTSLIIVATPGTGVLYTLAAGLARGARASVLAAFACTLGVVPHMAAAITGLAALLINILNPKLSIFFFAFLPQFVSTDDPNGLLRMLGLSAVFALMTFVVFVGYGLFAASVRTHVISRPQVVTWMRRVLGGAFAALGARLATTDR